MAGLCDGLSGMLTKVKSPLFKFNFNSDALWIIQSQSSLNFSPPSEVKAERESNNGLNKTIKATVGVSFSHRFSSLFHLIKLKKESMNSSMLDSVPGDQ